MGRVRIGFLALVLAMCGAGLCSGLARAAGLAPFGEDPPSVEGGEWHYLEDEKAVVLLGRATVAKGGMTVEARNMVYFTDTREIYAEGDVVAQEPGGSLFYCDRLYYHMDERRGEADNVRLMGQDVSVRGARPVDVHTQLLGPNAGKETGWESEGAALPYNRMFVNAKKMRALSADHFELFDPFVTTDNSASPVFGVSAQSAHYRRYEKIESWHNVLWVGGVPVFYFPYLIKDLRYDWPWMRASAGHSDDWGTYGLTTWGLDLDPDQDALFRLEKVFVDLDYREERGWATGLDFQYELGHRGGKGNVDTYWLKETEISRSDDLERAEEDTEYGDTYRDDDRWKVEWWHQQPLAGGWDLRFDLNVYSDRDFLFEYFRRQFNEDKEPESFLSLRRLGDAWVFEAVAQPRLNDFMTQEEYLPELRFKLPGYRLGDTPLYLTSETRVGIVNREFDEDANKKTLREEFRVPGDREYGEFFRADYLMRVSAPLPLGEAFTFTPYVGGRATYYEELADDDDGHTRLAGQYGAEITGRFYGLYRGGDLRHIIEPSIGFVANEDPTLSAKKLYHIDEVDLYEELHYFPLHLHTQWQEKRQVTDRDGVTSEQIVDLLDVDLSTRYIPLDGEAREFNSDRNWTPLDLDVVWRPTNRLSLYGNLSWALEDGYVTEGQLGADWRFRDHFRLHAVHRYRRGDTVFDPHLDKSSETTVALRWLASDKYAVEYAMAYEWADSTEAIDSGLSEQRLTLIRNVKVFELRVSWVRDPRDDEQGVYLTLSPVGIPALERASTTGDRLAGQMTGRYHPPMVDDVIEDVPVP